MQILDIYYSKKINFKLKSHHMQNLKFLVRAFLLMLVFFTACKKDDCDLQSKYVYEPIVFDEDCNCIVSGKVKYLRECQTVVLLDYGNGDCDNIAIKTICKNGQCELSAGAYKEEIVIDCTDAFVEGPISDEEALRMGI